MDSTDLEFLKPCLSNCSIPVHLHGTHWVDTCIPEKLFGICFYVICEPLMSYIYISAAAAAKSSQSCLTL